MSKKLQNILSFGLIVLYLLAAAIFKDVPLVGQLGRAVLVLGEIGVSAAYCLVNRPMERKELIGEVAFNAVLTAAAVILALSGLV